MAERIDIKQAVSAAIKYASEMFPELSYSEITLEETELSEDNRYWHITLGLTDKSNPFAGIGAEKRKYKLFKVGAFSGEVDAMRIRTVNE